MIPGMIFISIPYEKQKELSYKTACTVAAKLLEEGNAVIAPVIEGHAIETELDRQVLPNKRWIWQQSLELLRRCNLMIVITLPGWEESCGVKEEIKQANAMDIPVIFLSPDCFQNGNNH